ncbi:hypothetical protein AAIH00_11405 [Pseudomonas aeruginosa]
MIAGSDWQSRCGIRKIVQTDTYGCGVACLAMVAGISYEAARERFHELGLGVRRGRKPAYSTSSGEMRMAISTSGLITDSRRWRGWAELQGLAVIKVRDDWRGAKGRWHWAVAFRHPEFGIAVFDPHQSAPSFSRMPTDVECFDFCIYEPKGEWFQVEQSVPLFVGDDVTN